ncbi:MAG: hypothetical protein RMJ43_13840 [Chloroherpetonaceae bacterium]|nr:hypothetical protein [Chthonomonadaceae bacterium]MDW8208911.1 hypothetical protein [Chloroherpetonaceae bacterium]
MPSVNRRTLLGAMCLPGSVLSARAQKRPPEKMSFLDNGLIRIGIDLNLGGVITHLSSPKHGNVVNSHDYGRQIQQSYYSGPAPFGQPHPAWKDWPWNPIGTGDVYGNPARVLEHRNDGRTLYVKSVPMQWALNNVPGDCTFETWISLFRNTARVRCRLNNQRNDRTQYPARHQELPAVYTIGKLYRLFTYDGTAPFTGAPVRQIQNAGPPWTAWKATEHWAALVNDDDWGLGVFHAGAYDFVGGFHGPPNTGGPLDNSTGYIAPLRNEILDHNIVYTYEYVLILGTVNEIRRYAVSRRPRDTRPDYRFRTDRQHWYYVNAEDTGFPPRNGLQVKLEQEDPQMIGPEQWWQAKDVPVLYLRAAFHTSQDRAEIFWSVPGQGFAPERSLSFQIRPDGRFHTYTIELASSPAYTGTISGLRLDPVPAGRKGDYVQVASLSWR